MFFYFLLLGTILIGIILFFVLLECILFFKHKQKSKRFLKNLESFCYGPIGSRSREGGFVGNKTTFMTEMALKRIGTIYDERKNGFSEAEKRL